MHLNDLQFFHTMTICTGLGISNENIAPSLKRATRANFTFCLLLLSAVVIASRC